MRMVLMMAESTMVKDPAKNLIWGIIFRDGAIKTVSGLYDRYIRCVRDIK